MMNRTKTEQGFLYDVTKVLQYKDGCVYRTKSLKQIFVPLSTVGDEAKGALAREHGGDFLTIVNAVLLTRDRP